LLITSTPTLIINHQNDFVSCDTEDCVMADEKSALHRRNKLNFKAY